MNKQIIIEILEDKDGFKLFTKKDHDLSWMSVIGFLETAKADILKSIRVEKKESD